MGDLLQSLSRFLVIVGVFAVLIGLIWLSTKTKFYRAREKKELQREIDELKSRPRPPWADDPIAKSIEWTGTSAFGSGPHFNPRGAVLRLASANANRIEFHPPSAGRWHVAMLFAGVASYIAGVLGFGSLTKALLFPLIFLCLAFAGWYYHREVMVRVVFDKHLGKYWRGKTTQAPPLGYVSSEKVGRISDIYALQLVSTRWYSEDPRLGVESAPGEWITYELNLVLKDATRLSMVQNQDYDRLDHDARALAAFLQKPLWKPG